MALCLSASGLRVGYSELEEPFTSKVSIVSVAGRSICLHDWLAQIYESLFAACTLLLMVLMIPEFAAVEKWLLGSLPHCALIVAMPSFALG